MRILITLFIIVNLIVFAHGLDRAKILNRQSRKHASDANTQTAKIGASKVAAASAASSAVKTAVKADAKIEAKATAAKTTTTSAAAAATTAKKTDAKATTTTTTTTTTTAAKKTDAKAQAATNAKDTKATAKTTAAASAKVFSKDASGKTIEHITKEAPPAGMVRPVMIPGPDAIPNTYTVHPVVEGQSSSRMMSHRSSSHHATSSSEDNTEQPEMSGESQPVEGGQEFSSSDSHAPTMSVASDDDNTNSNNDQPHFTAAKKNFGKNAVTADEVSSLSSEAQAPDDEEDSFPPKYPPCSCVARPKPQCCMVFPQPPYSHGWWHKNAAGHVHFHHFHTSDEDPSQVASEDEQTQEEDDGETPEAPETPEEGEQDGDEETPVPDPEDDATVAASSTGSEVPPSIAGEPDALASSTGEAASEETELTYTTVKALLEELLAKHHQTIVDDMATRLDQHQSTLATHLEDVKTELQGQLKIIADHLATVATELKNRNGAVIVENHIHHHHDDDDDADDDEDEAEENEPPPSTAFTSTGDGSTLDLLRSMEASTEELTNKLDQADVLNAAVGNDDDDDSDE